MLLFWVGFITRGRLKLLLGIALLAGCVLLISKSPFPKYKHFYELGASFQIRLENYLFSSQVFKENAVWGAGFHADLTRNLDDYAPKLFAKGLEYQYKGHFQTYNTFENIFIAFLVEMGGLFSITYFGGVAYLLIVFFKKFRAPPQKNLAGILTISVMAGFAFISCTFDTLRFPNLNWLFHSLLGLMVNLQNSGGNRSEPS